jgi:hypothetical protein
MTFEEFFKKKKIDLAAFEKGNPAMLFEFKNHFEQMGEKSFDHTKKYWFNKLRLQYHLAPEIKTEKVKMENPLAEQTVTDSLAESTLLEPRLAATSKFQGAPIPERAATENTDGAPAEAKPATGFTPRFKAGATKPAQPAPLAEENRPEEVPATDKPKVGFTPRFKAGVTKPADDVSAPSPEESKTEEPAKPNVGFTPRFKAGITKLADEPGAPSPEENKTEDLVKPKVGFTPRFKAGVTKATEPTSSTEEKNTEEAPVEAKPKIGFTPRFKAGVTKPAESADNLSEEKKEASVALPAEEIKPDEAQSKDKPKIGFTPRFKASSPHKQQDPPTEE